RPRAARRIERGRRAYGACAADRASRSPCEVDRVRGGLAGALLVSASALLRLLLRLSRPLFQFRSLGLNAVDELGAAPAGELGQFRAAPSGDPRPFGPPVPGRPGPVVSEPAGGLGEVGPAVRDGLRGVPAPLAGRIATPRR